MKLYGRSDVLRISGTPAGHDHDCRKNRFVAPHYGENNRSLAVVDCNDPVCIAFLRTQGFHINPDKVERTADEVEWVERAKVEGNVNSQRMADSLGRTLAELAAGRIVLPSK